MFIYPAICDVPTETLTYFTRLLHHHHQAMISGPNSASTARTQAKLVLTPVPGSHPGREPGYDHGLSQATTYRCLHEGIDVLAAQAPDLHEVLAERRIDELSCSTLDGTLILADRIAGRTTKGNHTWYSGKHEHLGGDIRDHR